MLFTSIAKLTPEVGRGKKKTVAAGCTGERVAQSERHGVSSCLVPPGCQPLLQAANDADGVCRRAARDALLRLLHPPEDLGGKQTSSLFPVFTTLQVTRGQN